MDAWNAARQYLLMFVLLCESKSCAVIVSLGSVLLVLVGFFLG